MARGGFRSGSGRKKGSKNRKAPEKPETLVFLSKAEEFAQFYGGMLARAQKGKKPSESEKQQMMKLAAELTKTYESGGENQGKPIAAKKALEGCIDTGKALTPEAAKYYDRMKYGEAASKYHPKGHLFGLIKLHPEKPSPTLTRSAGASKVVHWEEKRFIGIKERARFASFPDSFQWSGKWTDIYNRQGNSVPPNLMKAIAEHININILQRMTDAFPGIEIKRIE